MGIRIVENDVRWPLLTHIEMVWCLRDTLNTRPRIRRRKEVVDFCKNRTVFVWSKLRPLRIGFAKSHWFVRWIIGDIPMLTFRTEIWFTAVVTNWKRWHFKSCFSLGFSLFLIGFRNVVDSHQNCVAFWSFWERKLTFAFFRLETFNESSK